MMTIGDKIKFIRKKFGLSQEEFAKYFNVSQRSLSAMELGDRRVTYSFLETLIKKFNVNPNWLFDDDAEFFMNNK